MPELWRVPSLYLNQICNVIEWKKVKITRWKHTTCMEQLTKINGNFLLDQASGKREENSLFLEPLFTCRMLSNLHTNEKIPLLMKLGYQFLSVSLFFWFPEWVLNSLLLLYRSYVSHMNLLEKFRWSSAECLTSTQSLEMKTLQVWSQ